MNDSTVDRLLSDPQSILSVCSIRVFQQGSV